MCGTHDGLLTLIARPFTTPTTIGEESDRVSTLEALRNLRSVPIEEALATEGALWFPNLLVPDPQLILPFVLSGTLLANIILASSSRRNSDTAPSSFQRRVSNALKILALAIGPATLNLPAAMLVYWTSSSLFSVAQNSLLDRAMPLQPPVKPCKPRSTPSVLLSRRAWEK
ncbi:MAG: hypothetical protein M1838_004423 [Thelocarpon superellum]|nr:MAG: hypothetical protein M1838_004423 [Thelocarpon superellum]